MIFFWSVYLAFLLPPFSFLVTVSSSFLFFFHSLCIAFTLHIRHSFFQHHLPHAFHSPVFFSSSQPSNYHTILHLMICSPSLLFISIILYSTSILFLPPLPIISYLEEWCRPKEVWLIFSLGHVILVKQAPEQFRTREIFFTTPLWHNPSSVLHLIVFIEMK